MRATVRLVFSLFILIAVPAVARAQAKAPVPVKGPSLAELGARLDKLQTQLDELAKLSVDVPELSKRIDELGAQVAALRQDVDAMQRGAAGQGDLVERLDKLEARVGELGEQVSGLRADVAANGAPESVPAGGGGGAGGSWDGEGFRLVDGDAFSLRLFGYLQFRYATRVQEAFDETYESGFGFRRARIGVDGKLYSPRLYYKMNVEAAGASVVLNDAFVEGALPHGFKLRAGQFKVPFSRQFINPAEKLSFVERSVATEAFRYDRDIGALLTWTGVGDNLDVMVGMYNGGGKNAAKNDNIDPLLVGRVQMGVLGKAWKAEEGDLHASHDPQLMLGVAGTFENTPVPDKWGYGASSQALSNTDVDSDGNRDNVRVWQVEGDLSFRMRGVGVEGEFFLRDENWGVIGANQDPVITPGGRYMGFYGQASYFVMPERLQLGARYSWAETSPLALGGRKLDVPQDDERTEISGLVSYYRHEHGIELSAMYSFLDWKNADGPDVKGIGEQRFILEAQVMF